MPLVVTPFDSDAVATTPLAAFCLLLSSSAHDFGGAFGSGAAAGNSSSTAVELAFESCTGFPSFVGDVTIVDSGRELDGNTGGERAAFRGREGMIGTAGIVGARLCA